MRLPLPYHAAETQTFKEHKKLWVFHLTVLQKKLSVLQIQICAVIRDVRTINASPGLGIQGLGLRPSLRTDGFGLGLGLVITTLASGLKPRPGQTQCHCFINNYKYFIKFNSNAACTSRPLLQSNVFISKSGLIMRSHHAHMSDSTLETLVRFACNNF